MAVDTKAALAKLTSGQALSQAEKEALGLAPTTPAVKTVDTMTQAEIDAITAKQVASGGKSNDQSLTIPGETNAERNARITAGYKEMLAKPVLSEDQTAGGMTVQYVRTEAGGVGSYTAVAPIGYTGDRTVTNWTSGIIPSNSPYTTGTTLGVMSTGNGTYTPVTGAPVTTKTSTTPTETGRITNADGSVTVMYSDGSTKVIPKTTTVVTNGNGNGNGSGNTTTTTTSEPTTNVEVLKATLRGRGFNAKLIDASATYLQQLLKDGLDYDNAVEVFLSSKDYTLKNGTKITSPFYTEYGYLNESAPKPLSADELYGFVEGTKAAVTKYALNPKFATVEAMKQYIANGVTVTDIETRANTARIKALESDTSYVEALKKLGFINSAADLTDFYLDPKIGQDTLEQNKRTGTFAAEAVRRANQGIEVNKLLAEQQAAGLTAKGMSEAQIAATAAQGYAAIGEQLNPLTALSGIYEKGGAQTQQQLQSELEQEQFMGMASARRKRLTEQNVRAFEAAPGTSRYSLSQSGAAGIL